MEIITRSQWGARYAAGFGVAAPASELWLHHSVSRSAGVLATFEQDVAGVQTLERIGQQRFGGGISYTYVVCASGRVFEGTGPLRRGAHTRGRNSIARALCLLGDYSRARPTLPMLVATADLVRHGHARHWWTVDRLSGGHRDAPGASTACPGDAAYACIAEINARAGAGEVDDMFTEDDRRKLAEVYTEATKRLPNRRGVNSAELAGHGADTVLGWAAQADGFGFRNEHLLVRVLNQLDDLSSRLAALEAKT